MQTVKIQINSLEALERLIGGDSQLEIELRSSVAAAFAEKHLKNMVRQMADAGLTESVRQLIDAEILSTVPDQTRPSYYSSTVKVLKPAVRELLKKELDKLVSTELAQLVHETRQELYAKLDQGLGDMADWIKTSLEPRISDQIIYHKVKEKLASL